MTGPKTKALGGCSGVGHVEVMSDTMVDAKVIRGAVRLACRAPSLHNSQPWRWVVDTGGLHRFLDPARLMISADNSGREVVISGHLHRDPRHRTGIPVALVGGLLEREARLQALIRIGLAPAIEQVPPPSPRRALEEVLQFG